MIKPKSKNLIIALPEYLAHGGLLDNIYMPEVFINFPATPEISKFKISQIQLAPIANDDKEPLYNVSFTNGYEKRYHGKFINIHAEFKIAERYRKPHRPHQPSLTKMQVA